MAGFNDDEVLDLARYAVDNDMDISFIEEMPLGAISSHERSKTQVTSEQVREQLEREFTLVDSAKLPVVHLAMQVSNSTSKIGFISPMSNNFCSSCNRVRLTCTGQLHPLFG